VVTALGTLQHLAAVHPLWAVMLFVAVRSMSVIWPPLPGFPFDIIGIRVFGLAEGFVLAEVGIMLGASVAFVIARRVRDSLGVRKAQTLRQLEGRLRDAGWLTEKDGARRQFRQWFTLRLLTNPLFDPISYVAGLTTVRAGPYLLGSLLGNAPSMLVLYVLENNAVPVGTIRMILATVAFLAAGIWLAHRALIDRADGKRERARTNSDAIDRDSTLGNQHDHIA
jgi:uncharacterized membrane protein YdjX (TVP38/TMEM64 family)